MTTTLYTPPLEHSFLALARANEVRVAQVQLRNELRAGLIDIADAINDERADSIRIFDLLRCQRRWGPTKARALCHRLMIGELRRCGELTLRQKGLIVAEVRR